MVFLRGTQDHARRRFAARTGAGVPGDGTRRVMGAVVNAGNFNALPVQKGEHPVVQGQDIGLPIKTAGDAGLIGNDDQKVAQLPKHSQGIDHTW